VFGSETFVNVVKKSSFDRPHSIFIGEHQPAPFIFADKKLNGVGQMVIFWPRVYCASFIRAKTTHWPPWWMRLLPGGVANNLMFSNLACHGYAKNAEVSKLFQS
jgi:hypothetical protein